MSSQVSIMATTSPLMATPLELWVSKHARPSTASVKSLTHSNVATAHRDENKVTRSVLCTTAQCKHCPLLDPELCIGMQLALSTLLGRRPHPSSSNCSMPRRRSHTLLGSLLSITCTPGTRLSPKQSQASQLTLPGLSSPITHPYIDGNTLLWGLISKQQDKEEFTTF